MVTPTPNDLSAAIVLYLGFNSGYLPFGHPERVLDEFGVTRGEELVASVKSLVREAGSTEVDWSKHTLESAGKMARDAMKGAHPELSEEALDALVWNFKYEWR